MSIRRYRPLALLLLVLQLGACTSWRPITVSPQQLIEAEQPSSVRVTQPDGVQVVLKDPAIRNDSIVGTDREGFLRHAEADGLRLEVKRFSIGKTIGLVGVAMVSVAAYITYEFFSSLTN